MDCIDLAVHFERCSSQFDVDVTIIQFEGRLVLYIDWGEMDNLAIIDALFGTETACSTVIGVTGLTCGKVNGDNGYYKPR